MVRVPSGGERKNVSMPAIISGFKGLRLAARDSLSTVTEPRRLVSSSEVMGSSSLSGFGSYETGNRR